MIPAAKPQNDPVLSIVTWKWASLNPYRTSFRAVHVNTFASMIRRNLTIPHRVFCITDNPAGIDEDITTVRLWDNPVPHYGTHHRPNCYVRLKAFSKEFEQIVGPRFVSMDLDCVITGNIDHLFDRPDDFMIWGETHDINPYNGSMWMMNAGARAHVWDDFDPAKSPEIAMQKRFFGSDQAWMCYALGPDEKRWSTSDGVYSYRCHIRPLGGSLPGNAKIVFFHGQYNPWDADMQKIEWVMENWK